MNNSTLKHAIGLGALACAVQVSAQVTFYEQEGFQGRSFTADRPIGNFERHGFNDRASSVIVRSERWEVCEDARFSGRCVVLRRGEYPTLAAMGLDNRVSSVRSVAASARIADDRYAPAPMAPEVRFFEREGFDGRSFATSRPVGNFERFGFNDRASSAIVVGTNWEACEDARFSGRCVVLRPGRYPSLASMGLNDRISSVRVVERAARVDDNRYAPPAPVPVYDARRRPGERLYDARVTDVRAVIGASGQRCWVERQEIPAERSSANVPGAIAGAVIGGILGHQIGGGTGRDIATVGGVVAGAAVGANVGRDNRPPEFRDVQRCGTVPGQARPDYWDVTYDFRGTEHHVQTTAPPGPTISVNERGEPRG